MTAHQILPGLWLGDANDAVEWKGPRLFVGEDSAEEYGYYRMRSTDAHIPVLDRVLMRTLGEPAATKDKLDAAVEHIRARIDGANPILVHCHAGIERSPLTVSVFLWKTRIAGSFDEAFDFVRSKRPQVQYRGHWLPPEYRTLPSQVVKERL